MGSCITHFSWPDAGLCEVPSKPTLARAKGVGRYMCVFQCGIYTLAQTLLYHFKLCVEGFFCTCCRKMNVLIEEKHIYCTLLLMP